MSLGVRALTDKEKNTNQCFASLITPKQKGEKKGWDGEYLNHFIHLETIN